MADFDESLPEWIGLRVGGLPENNKLQTFNTFFAKQKEKKDAFMMEYFLASLCFLCLASFVCQQSNLITLV